MGRVVHFEFYTEDVAKTVAFFKDVFGWDMQAYEGPIEYTLVTTGPREEIGIDGGIAPVVPPIEQRCVITIAVDDVDAVITKAVAAGACTALPREAIPGVGYQAYLTDPSGMVFGIHQADPMAGMEPGVEVPGGVTGEAPGAGDPWSDVGERLRDLGASIGRAFGSTAASPQAQRVREEAEKAGAAIRDVSRQTADKARPYVLTALERVSTELDGLAERLRTEPEAEQPQPEGVQPGEPPHEPPVNGGETPTDKRG